VNVHVFESVGNKIIENISERWHLFKIVVLKSGDLSLEEVLTYELSPYPPALFEARNILRTADKLQHA